MFSVLAYGSRNEGVVAVAAIPERELKSIRLPERALVAVLENIEKPGNVGAVVRSADAAGVSAVIVAGDGSDLYNPNAIRASLGTIFTLPVCAATTSETIAWLRQQKLKIFAARVDGAVDYTACDFTGACAIVLGSEAEGLSDEWRADRYHVDSIANARGRGQLECFGDGGCAVLRSAAAAIMISIASWLLPACFRAALKSSADRRRRGRG